MKISYQELKSLQACSEGLKWFKQTYGKNRPIEVSALKDRLLVDGFTVWASWLCGWIDAPELSIECYSDYECWMDDIWRNQIVHGNQWVYRHQIVRGFHCVYENHSVEGLQNVYGGRIV